MLITEGRGNDIGVRVGCRTPVIGENDPLVAQVQGENDEPRGLQAGSAMYAHCSMHTVRQEKRIHHHGHRALLLRPPVGSVTCTRRKITAGRVHIYISTKLPFFISSSSHSHFASTMTKAYLLSRTLDPLLAVFTGLFAFHLNQNNPRTAPPPGHTLQELLRWKWAESKKIREARDKEASEEWENVTRELVGGASVEETKR